MMRPDLGDIIERAKRRRFYVTVNSNLTLYDRHAESLSAADLVYTSLDGDPRAHEAARGEHAGEGVLDAIARLVRGGKPVIAICVVTEHSIRQAELLLQQAEAIGFRMHFQPQCVDTEIVRGAAPQSVSDDDFRAFWRHVLAEKRSGRPIVSSVPYLEFLSTWEDFSVSAYHDPSVRCPAGRGYLYVDPRGNAYACAYVKGKTTPVDLLADDWRAAWTGETPCTVCTVGPMLEFNLLFKRPVTATLEGLRAYG